LDWASSHDNRALLGYNVYENNIRIGFTPLTNFSVEKKLGKKKEIYFEVKAIDLHGNESAASKKFLLKE
jgi:hypothetical protein